MKQVIVPNGKKKNQQMIIFIVCLPSNNWKGFGNFAAFPVSSCVASASPNNSICCPEEMERLRAIRRTNHAAPISIFPKYVNGNQSKETSFSCVKARKLLSLKTHKLDALEMLKSGKIFFSNHPKRDCFHQIDMLCSVTFSVFSENDPSHLIQDTIAPHPVAWKQKLKPHICSRALPSLKLKCTSPYCLFLHPSGYV